MSSKLEALYSPLLLLNTDTTHTSRFLRREGESYGIVLEVAFVRSIAEGLILRHAAAAKRYRRAPTQVVRVAVLVYNLKVAFYFQRAVVVYRDLSASHTHSCLIGSKAI